MPNDLVERLAYPIILPFVDSPHGPRKLDQNHHVHQKLVRFASIEQADRFVGLPDIVAGEYANEQICIEANHSAADRRGCALLRLLCRRIRASSSLICSAIPASISVMEIGGVLDSTLKAPFQFFALPVIAWKNTSPSTVTKNSTSQPSLMRSFSRSAAGSWTIPSGPTAVR